MAGWRLGNGVGWWSVGERRQSRAGSEWERLVAASVGNRAPAVVRRSEQRRFSSASDDEVGGCPARDARAASPKEMSVGPSKYELQGPTCSRSYSDVSS